MPRLSISTYQYLPPSAKPIGRVWPQAGIPTEGLLRSITMAQSAPVPLAVAVGEVNGLLGMDGFLTPAGITPPEATARPGWPMASHQAGLVPSSV